MANKVNDAKQANDNKSLFGRIIHDVPTSLLNKPKPSDKPTKVLPVEEPVIKQNVKNSPKTNKDDAKRLETPGTTVLGLGFDDDFDDPDSNQDLKQKDKDKVEDTSKVKINKVEKPKEKTQSKKVVAASAKASSSGNKKTRSKAAPRNAKLTLVRKLNGDIVKITKKDFVIGKSKYSDFQVKGNNTVSRSHIIAHKLKDGSLTIEDNDSKNGTFLDEVRLKAHDEVKVKDGQTLRLSDEIFIVKKL